LVMFFFELTPAVANHTSIAAMLVANIILFIDPTSLSPGSAVDLLGRQNSNWERGGKRRATLRKNKATRLAEIKERALATRFVGWICRRRKEFETRMT
jgi:hypothetical protein